MDNNSKESKQSFFQKFKNDKKYRAKVQLIGYTVFIVFLIVFINVSNVGNNYSYNSVDSNLRDNVNDVLDDDSNLFEDIDDNYSYNVDVVLKTKDSNNNDVESKVNYNGDSYRDNLVINKVYDNVNSTYYKVGDEYYYKELDEFKLAVLDDIYNLIDAKYIEFSSVNKYIDKAGLDHFTDYSSGKKEYVYDLLVRDVILSYKGEDTVPINVVIDNNIVSISIDYTNLLKNIDNNIVSCVVNYKYENIGKVEEFTIIPDDYNDPVNTTATTGDSTN